MNLTLNVRFSYSLEVESNGSGICIVLESHSALLDCHLNGKATSAASEVLCYGQATLVLLSKGLKSCPLHWKPRSCI